MSSTMKLRHTHIQMHTLPSIYRLAKILCPFWYLPPHYVHEEKLFYVTNSLLMSSTMKLRHTHIQMHALPSILQAGEKNLCPFWNLSLRQVCFAHSFNEIKLLVYLTNSLLTFSTMKLRQTHIQMHALPPIYRQAKNVMPFWYLSLHYVRFVHSVHEGWLVYLTNSLLTFSTMKLKHTYRLKPYHPYYRQAKNVMPFLVPFTSLHSLHSLCSWRIIILHDKLLVDVFHHET